MAFSDKQYTSRHNFWYRALSEASNQGMEDPLDARAPDVALYLGALASVEPHNEDKLPKSWRKFAEVHPQVAQKIRTTATRFLPLGVDGELNIKLPDDGTVPKWKTYLGFRFPTAEETREHDKKTKKSNPKREKTEKKRKAGGAGVANTTGEGDDNSNDSDAGAGDGDSGDGSAPPPIRKRNRRVAPAGRKTQMRQKLADIPEEEDGDAGDGDAGDGDAGDGDSGDGGASSRSRIRSYFLMRAERRTARLQAGLESGSDSEEECSSMSAVNNGVDAEQAQPEAQQETPGSPIRQPADSDTTGMPATQPLHISFNFETSTANKNEDIQQDANMISGNGEGDINNLLAQATAENGDDVFETENGENLGENHFE